MTHNTWCTFEETIRQHAARLGQSQRWTKIRRRALLLKMDGFTPNEVRTQMGSSNCPYAVANAAIDHLMAVLSVRFEEKGRQSCLVPNPSGVLPRGAVSSVGNLTRAPPFFLNWGIPAPLRT